MKCNSVKCIFIRARVKNMEHEKIQEQLEKCEKCAYRKDVGKLRRDTYAVVRHNFVKTFWESLAS